MAIYTLPNGAQWYSTKNTEDQTDEKAQEFVSLMKESVQAVTTKVTGPNPNLPKIQSKAWTDTSYPDYNYILTTIYNYKNDNTYAMLGATERLTREAK